MASVHKDPRNKSPYWYCAYRLPNGKRVFRSTKQTDRKAAEEFCRKLEYASRESKAGLQARDCFREKALQTIKTAFEQGDWRAAVAALKLVFAEYRDGAKIDVNAIAVSSNVMREPERLKLIAARRQLALERVGATQGAY